MYNKVSNINIKRTNCIFFFDDDSALAYLVKKIIFVCNNKTYIMKKALLIISTIATLQAQAQNLGVNTLTPHASAIMDITHTSRGLLIPRLPLVDVNDVTTIASPALSLLIFNTATAGIAPNDVKPGFYYFNGTKWVGIGTGSAWDLLGNTGTNSATNFLGTTDAQDLVFKTNSIENMRILNTNGNVGVGTNAPLTKMHVIGNLTTSNPAQNLNISLTPDFFGNSYIQAYQSTGVFTPLTIDGAGITLNGKAASNILLNPVAGGNVGIGTLAPLNKLEITHGTAGNSGLRFTNLPNAIALSTNATGDVIPTTLNPANALYWGLTGNSGTTPATNFVGTTDAQDLVFKTNSVENMRVTSGGNVGIGTSTPITLLDVSKKGVFTSNIPSMNIGDNALNFAVANDTETNGIVTFAGIGWVNGILAYYPHKLNNRGAFRLTSQSINYADAAVDFLVDGNVGIGTTAPTYKLHVANGSVRVDGTANTGANSALLMFGLNNSTDIGYVGDGSSSDNNMYLYSYSNDVRIGTGVLSTASNSIYLDQAGNTGIGTIPAASSAKLDVVSTTAGFAMPRMTSAQRKAIVAPVAGLDVYDLTLKGHYTFDGTKWDCSDNPAGSVNYFANATVPNGYLECNGQSVSTTTYAELFAAIGYLYGGAGASFNVPDLRGEFVRGASNGRAGVDVGRVIGTAQPATAIRGYIDGDAPLNPSSATYIASANTDGAGPTIVGSALYMAVGNTAAPAAYYGSFTVKPRNVAMLPCIKF
jgi:microcystin-dependent protein